MKALVLVCLLAIILSPVGCQSTEAKEDRAIVTCAEEMLWDYADLVDREILVELALDGIVLSKDEDPFGDHKDYIGFKADFYRDMFEWGRLPPEDIMNKCGVESP